MNTLRNKISWLLLLLIGFTSCKKDLLHFKTVEKLDSHFTNRINHIQFIGDNVCIISGGEKYSKTEVGRSQDGGNTWASIISSDQGVGMYGLGISPSGKIFLSGFYGTILSSTDTGTSWTTEHLPQDPYLVSSAWPTDNTGIFISTITSDSGSVFLVDTALNIQKRTRYGFGLNDIVMADVQNGYICGLGVVLKTTDGGQNWNYTDIKNDNFNGIYCKDKDHVWVCGFNGSIFKTTNGGDSWERLRNGNDIFIPHYYLNDIVFLDDQHGYAVGDYGTVIYTDDGGIHWMEYDRFTSEHLNAVAKCPNGDLLVGGEKGTLYRLKTKS